MHSAFYNPELAEVVARLIGNGEVLDIEVVCSIPASLDITRGSSLVVTHGTADVRVMSDRSGTP